MRQLNKKFWAYQYSIKADNYRYAIIEEWCSQHIGNRYINWYAYDTIFAFNDPESATMFNLKWGKTSD